MLLFLRFSFYFFIVPVGVSLSPGLFYILEIIFEMIPILETHGCYKYSQKRHISLLIGLDAPHVIHVIVICGQ